MDLDVSGAAFEWRGPAPYVFVALDAEAAAAVHAVAAVASYGWGCITVTAQVGETTWTTSLMPRNGGYLLPLKLAVRQAESIELGDRLTIRLALTA